jgi:hypothetical protein
MLVVLDTNVIVSALLSPGGPPAEIVRCWEGDEFEVVTSLPLIAELERVLAYPQVRRYLKASKGEIAAFLRRMRTVATVVEPQMTLDVIEADPDDNRVLECAATGGAAYIVSGDEHLLGLGEYEQIIILNPVSFLTLLKIDKS